MKERASGGGEPDAGHFVDGPVCADAAAAGDTGGWHCARYRWAGAACLGGGLRGDEVAGHNQTFLIGEADGFASFDGLEVASRPETPTMALTTKSTLGWAATRTVPAAPWRTSVRVSPAARSLARRELAADSLATETTWASSAELDRGSPRDCCRRPAESPESGRDRFQQR